ncbi:extracellular solute-binding protein [Caldicoprobacter algeriensis]|uniref:ABC transporter substrate-binding protein n=1 Tax=Caldicoprobacter algeriensis TaxID=699281 RepID=UPI00207A61BF|nr:extracellular solute-binding protein [Caldicoprobacter algeriensis]MCM8900429.1 extracellular solute-binding protein [Caldicoprobacter algeriensis]
MLKKKILIGLVVLVMTVALVLNGCTKQKSGDDGQISNGQKEEGTSEQTDKQIKNVAIELLHGQPEEARVKTIQSIIDSFMVKNPGITVKQVPVPEDGLWTKITALMSSGQLPAMIEGSIDQMRLMYEEGVIDTEANTKAINSKGTDAFFKGALAVLKLPDKEEYIGVPVSGWVAGIWYRKDWFEEKGFSAPDTWENILKAAQTFYDPDNKKYGIVFATEVSDFTEQTFQQIALSNNAELFDGNGQPKFNSPEMKEAVQFYKDLYQYSPKGSNGVTQVKDTFVGGNAAMAMYSTYIMPSLYEQNMADKIGFAIPTKKVAASFGMTSTMTISNMVKPEEREAAVKFLAYMLEREPNIMWLHMAPGGANPVLRDIAKDEKYLSHELLKAFGETAAKVPEAFEDLRMFGFQDGKTHPKMGNITAKLVIPKALNAILVQNKDIDEEMERAQQLMEEIVNE